MIERAKVTDKKHHLLTPGGGGNAEGTWKFAVPLVDIIDIVPLVDRRWRQQTGLEAWGCPSTVLPSDDDASFLGDKDKIRVRGRNDC